MDTYVVRNPDYENRIVESFSRQAFMTSLNAKLGEIAPGRVEIKLHHDERLCQQHGFFHGGVIGTLADNVAAYAAFSLMPAEDTGLTIEYKINFISPGDGQALLAWGCVIHAGRRMTVCRSDVYSVREDRKRLCATALCTIATMIGRPDRKMDRIEAAPPIE